MKHIGGYEVWNGSRLVGWYASAMQANHVADWNIRFGQTNVAIVNLYAL